MWSIQNSIKRVHTLQDLKKYFRTQSNYDKEWQFVQEWLYTAGLKSASVNVGARNLFEKLRSRKAEIFIVSHKSPLSTNKRVDLVGPARQWIKDNLSDIPEINTNHIFFEETRILKVKRIESLGLTHFVDDLIEVFHEENFPKNIKSFWLTNDPIIPSPEGITVVKTLDSVVSHV